VENTGISGKREEIKENDKLVRSKER